MSALPQEMATCVCGSDHFCACGCGQELNPNLRRAHELVAAGATHAQAAQIIGISREGVSILLRKPPRFIVGHVDAATRERGRLKALATHARARELRDSAHSRYLRNALRREFGEGTFRAYPPSNWRWSVAEEFFPDELAAWQAERERVRAERERVKTERQAERERVRAAKRARWFRPQRIEQMRPVSLDAPAVWDDDQGMELYERASFLVATPDPFAEAHRERFWEIVGDLDVTRLGERELERLRERLLLEGFAPPSVQAAERERLAAPDRHSGESVRSAKGHSKKVRGTSKTAHGRNAQPRHTRAMTKQQKREHGAWRRGRREHDWMED